MTDREMLELAAKAAGFTDISISPMLKKHASDPEKLVVFAVDTDFSRVFWNPLVDDGAALQLAVKLRISVHFMNGRVCAHQGADGNEQLESSREDVEANTRRAITRAAAEIGKAMQETTS